MLPDIFQIMKPKSKECYRISTNHAMIKKISFFALVISTGVVGLVFLWPKNILNYLENPIFSPTTSPEESPVAGAGGCIATGCSGQICAEEEVITTCEFLPEYACYKTARCERQSDGQCGWTSTPELVRCLDQNR